MCYWFLLTGIYFISLCKKNCLYISVLLLESNCLNKINTFPFQMKAVAGMKMSYQVQQAINTCPKDPVRGFRHDESSSALCSHLYSMIRGNRQHRRAFLISLLNLFDDTAVSITFLSPQKKFKYSSTSLNSPFTMYFYDINIDNFVSLLCFALLWNMRYLHI